MSDARSPAVIVRERRVAIGALALMMGVFVSTASLDHGYNWDEWKQTETVRDTVREVEFDQSRLAWSGVAFMPSVLVAVLHMLPELPGIVVEMRQRPDMPFTANRYPSLSAWQVDIYRRTGGERFKAEARLIHVLLTVPALLWVFLTVLRVFPRRYLEASAAAGFLGLSWEVAQRARCTEVDAPMMQFAALTILLISVALTARSRAGGLVSAIGLGASLAAVMGCKVSGVYMAPVALIAVLRIPLWRGWRDRLVLLGAFGLALVAVYAMVSPDTYTGPIRTVHSAFYTMRDYASVNREHPYFVEAPFEHLGRVFVWLSCVQPSPVVPLAVPLSLVTAVGLVAVVRRRRAFALIVGLYPAALLLTMMNAPILQLRNYLQLIPILAIAFATGIIAIRHHLRRPPLELAVGLAIGAILLFNAAFLFRADWSVRHTTRDSLAAEIEEELATTDHDLWVSPRVHQSFEEALEARFDCQPGRPPSEMREPQVLFYYMDHHPRKWKSFRLGLSARIFAPLDQNYEWYVTWKGKLEHHRVHLMSIESAELMEVPFTRYYGCRRR